MPKFLLVYDSWAPASRETPLYGWPRGQVQLHHNYITARTTARAKDFLQYRIFKTVMLIKGIGSDRVAFEH
jgi:hypothetical protein